MQYHYLYLRSSSEESLYEIGVEAIRELNERFGNPRVTSVSRIGNLSELFRQYQDNDQLTSKTPSLIPALQVVSEDSPEFGKIRKYVELRHILRCKPNTSLASVLNEALEHKRRNETSFVASSLRFR
ncbi:MAG TPA: hypothetical protein VJH20_02955 [Candidatus Nanoarchaeia archaeon]|nr:hypothetical protein [Candidatus Nanoarchaeia archaeon]